MNIVFWALMIVMLLLAIIILVYPLLRVRGQDSLAYKDSNLKINEDKLNELDIDLNDLDSLAIFRQAQNGVLVRMALFALTLGVEDQLTQYEKEVNWHTNKR